MYTYNTYILCVVCVYGWIDRKYECVCVCVHARDILTSQPHGDEDIEGSSGKPGTQGRSASVQCREQ